MEEKVLEIGDIVELKSGGPAMTVSFVRDAESVEVCWFSREGFACSGNYDPRMLRPREAMS